MDQLDRRLILGAAGLAGVAAISRLAKGGPIDPPAGPVVPTGKTVQQIYDKIARTDAGLAEPRIPVQSLPGSATALHVISEPGSYYLTGNIQGVGGKGGILIASSNVRLDLGGFALLGSAGTLFAIQVADANLRRICIQGGFIDGWEGSAIDAATARSVVLEELSVSNDYLGCSRAMLVGPSSLIRNVLVSRFCSAVFAEEGSLIQDCVVRDCESGFFLRRSTVQRCVASNLNGTAFYMETSGVVTDCEIRQVNGGGVILHTGEGSLVRGNNISRCNIGILVQNAESATIAGNQLSQNSAGIVLEANSRAIRIEENNIVGDSQGVRADGQQAIILRNSVRTGSTPFQIASGNSHGPIVTVAGFGNISAIPNANHPWANFVY